MWLRRDILIVPFYYAKKKKKKKKKKKNKNMYSFEPFFSLFISKASQLKSTQKFDAAEITYIFF